MLVRPAMKRLFCLKAKNGLSVIYTTGGVYKRLYTPPVVYISAYIHYRRSFAAHTSGGPENSWSTSAWAGALMQAIVEPK